MKKSSSITFAVVTVFCLWFVNNNWSYPNLENIPQLTEERRVELKKIMGGLAEKAKIAIRNIRREANDILKKDLKDKKISEDESNKYEKKIQN